MREETASASRIAALSAFVAVFMIAQQIASKAVRDGFFLAQYDVTALPVATFAAAVVSFGAALLLGKFMTAFSPAAAVPVLFAANGVAFGVEAALVEDLPRAIAAALFLHTAAFGGAVVSGFWSVINERFDPYTAKRVMGRIAGGATFGGVAGGALTWAFADVAPKWLLTGFGASSLLCAVGIAVVARGGQREGGARKAAPLLAGVSVLAGHTYPRLIALLVFGGALMTATADYVFKASAVEATEGGSLVGFFAVFYTATGVLTFLVQALGSRRALQWLGVVVTAALLPAVAAGLLAVAAIWPTLGTLVLLRGGAMVVENSLYRSGYELLYMAMPREQKRSAKVLIDLGCDRLGTAASSGLVLTVLALGSYVVDRALLLIALLVAVGLLVLLVGVRREYVASLAGKLRRSLVPEDDADDIQARMLAATFVAEVDIWESDLGGPATTDPGARSRRLTRDELLERVRARADEKTRAAPARSSAPVAPRSLVSETLLATPLRARLRGVADLDDELRHSAPALIGQLGDLALSRRESLHVRLRAVELLAVVPSRRGAATSVELLQSPELRLRRMGALALLRMCTAAPALRPPQRTLTEQATKELRRPSRPLGERTTFERTSPFRTDARGNEIAPSLEQVFLLLAIRGETEELQLALSAITSEDAVQRGTGLEYLENLLPGDLRPNLLALAENPELTQADRRVSGDVVQALAAELRSGQIDLRTLRTRFRDARRDQYDRRL